MYEEGKGITKNEGQAAIHYKQACDGGHPAGCSYLGTLYGNGRGVQKDLARATTLHKQACDGGEILGCLELARLSPSEVNAVLHDVR